MLVCLTPTQSSSHGGRQSGAYGGACPRTNRNADSAGCGLGKVGDAFEVHIPALHAAHHLLAFGDRVGRARPGTDLTNFTEFVGAKGERRGRNQRHIRSNAGEPYGRAETPADERPVPAEFTQTRRDGGRNQQEGIRRRSGVRAGIVAPGTGSARA